MPEHKRFNLVERSQSFALHVDLKYAGRAVCEVTRDFSQGTPIWKWQINLDGAPVANGASLSLANTSATILLTWKRLRALYQTPPK